MFLYWNHEFKNIQRISQFSTFGHESNEATHHRTNVRFKKKANLKVEMPLSPSWVFRTPCCRECVLTCCLILMLPFQCTVAFSVLDKGGDRLAITTCVAGRLCLLLNSPLIAAVENYFFFFCCCCSKAFAFLLITSLNFVALCYLDPF